MKKTLSMFLLGGVLGAAAAPIFQLDTDRPSERREVAAGRYLDFGTLKLNKNSVLRATADPARLAAEGTVFCWIIPDRSFGTSQTPQIIFQLGGRHWEPNNLTLMRESDGSMQVVFFGPGGRVFHKWKGGIRPGKLNSFAVSYDNEHVKVFANGRRLALLKSPGPLKLSSGSFSIGTPADPARTIWNYTGDLLNLVIDDTALPEAQVTETMGRYRFRPLAPAAENGPYVRQAGNTVQIGGDKLELQVTASGLPLAMYDKRTGRLLIADWQETGPAWWSFTTAGGTPKSYDASQASAAFSVETRDGMKSAVWRYTLPENRSVFTVRVTPSAAGELRFGYTFTNRFGQPVKEIYFPNLGGFTKGRDSWGFIPRWQGIRRDLKKNFRYLCYGGPGHLSMMLLGLGIDDCTLLLYPQDPAGHVKFAAIDDRGSGPNGTVRVNWQNRDWVLPGETYAADHEFVLANVGDTGLRGLAEEYRKWATKQPWYVTFVEKRRNNPNLDRVLNGVVKMVGYEAFGKNGRVYDPDRAAKDKTCPFTYNYADFLRVADRIETVYGVKPAYRYDGWWGRFDSGYPVYFPVDRRLGGSFKEFMDANRSKGRVVFLHTNPIQYDFESPKFDIKKMALQPGGTYQEQSWSRNRLYFVTPRAVSGEVNAAVREMVAQGANGIFEDVIGCTTLLDVNPAGNYPYCWRDAGTAAVVELTRQLRESSGSAFRGTEGGEERRMPYYDAFMMGAGDHDEYVPFISMVYGDCIANCTGIEGGESGVHPHDRARRMLFGVILGADGRHDWARRGYSAGAQMIFRTQQVLKETVGKRILDYRQRGFETLSIWENACVVANLDRKRGTGGITFTGTPLGTVTLSNPAADGVVLIRKDGAFAAYRAAGAEVDGRQLFTVPPDAVEAAAVVFDGKELAVGNLGPERITLPMPLDGGALSGDYMIRPSGRTGRLASHETITLNSNEVIFIR